MVCWPVCLGIKHSSGLTTKFLLIRLLRVCGCAALSLKRERVCLLQILVALAIFGSESRGSRDHILLSQIRDFLFRRLLRLTRLRLEVFDPTSTRVTIDSESPAFFSLHIEYLIRHEPHGRHRVQQFFCCYFAFDASGTCSSSCCLQSAVSSGSTVPDFMLLLGGGDTDTLQGDPIILILFFGLISLF
jgi:hypothetical protein